MLKGPTCRDHSLHAPSQWETMFNIVMSSLIAWAYTKWSLFVVLVFRVVRQNIFLFVTSIFFTCMSSYTSEYINIRLTGAILRTHFMILSLKRNFQHWLHWMLSKWQLLVETVRNFLSKWHFSDWIKWQDHQESLHYSIRLEEAHFAHFCQTLFHPFCPIRQLDTWRSGLENRY